MHFTTTTLTLTLALYTLLGTSSALQTIKLVKHSTTTCSDGGGPTRSYNSGECYTFYDSDNAVKLADMPRGCTLVTYKDKGCAGVTSHYGTDRLNQCISLKSRWSMKVVGC